MFNRFMMSAAITALGTALIASAASAQTAAPAATTAATSDDTVVVVTGTRKSLRDALATKRAATGIVEALSSKDIGALPDVTIAESLARLPGINTTRDRGNDSQATIRGLGSRFVLGTINGREVATSEPDRGVRWEIYPSEVVSGVVVSKSSEAKLISGGIAGTVDIQTVRPLDYRGPALTLRAGPTYYDGGKAFPGYDGLGYRGSLSYVAKVSSDLAFVFGLTGQKQKNGYESFQGWGYNDNTVRPANSPGPIVTGGPTVFTPWGAQSEAKFLTETRSGATFGMQWRPVDGFELNYDLLYSDVKIDEHQNQTWYGSNNWGNWAGGNVDSYTNPRIVDNDLVGATTAWSSVEGVIAQYTEDKTLLVTGVNAKWTSEKWTVSTDINYSAANRYNVWAANEFTYYPQSMTWELDGKPSLSVSGATPTSGQTVNPGAIDPGRLEDSLISGRVVFTRRFDGGPFTALLFGARYNVRTKGTGDETFSATPVVSSVPTGLLSTWSFDHFNIPALNDADFHKLETALYGANALSQVGGVTYSTSNKSAVPILSKVRENVAEAYGELTYASTLSSVPVDGNIGLRLIDVKTQASGISQSGGAWFEDLSGNWAYYPLVQEAATGSSHYTKLLPSATARFDYGNGVYLKLALARVISRPPLSDMRATRSISPIAPYTGSSGNPFLKPFEATQLDASYEHYFGKDGLFAVSGYYKDVSNYVGYAQRTQVINGNSYTLTSPVNSTKKGSIEGAEVTYQSPIPGSDHFGIYSTYAYANSDIKEFVANLPMVGVARNSATLDLWYSDPKLDMRLGLKYHSPYTAIFGWDDSSLGTVDSETTLGFSSSYKINDNVTVRFQANNLLNTPLKTYADGKPDRLTRYDVYGRSYLVDLTLKY